MCGLMMDIILKACIFMCGLLFVAGESRTIVLPTEPLEPVLVTCTSHSGLCDMTYNISIDGTYQVIHGHRPMCRCPGRQQCRTDWHDQTNSISTVLKNAGQEMQMKMTYCGLHRPDNVCRFNEEAIVLKGRGPFVLDIAEDFKCRCYRQLYAHASWRIGDMDYISYSCGKTRCRRNRNRHSSNQCTRITYNGSPDNLRHDYQCRCLRNEECIADRLPTAQYRVVMKTCQPYASIRNGNRRHR